jgi:hypothetical protein
LAHQDASKVRRVIRELREAPGDPGRHQELDQLQERVRKLSAQVDELEARLKAKPAGN